MLEEPQAQQLPLERHLAKTAARIRLPLSNGSCDSEWSAGSNLFLVATTLTTEALLSISSPVLLGRANDQECAFALAAAIEMLASLAARLTEEGHDLDLQRAVGQMVGVVIAGQSDQRLGVIVDLAVDAWQHIRIEEGKLGILRKAAQQAGLAYATGHVEGVALFAKAVELSLATRTLSAD